MRLESAKASSAREEWPIAPNFQSLSAATPLSIMLANYSLTHSLEVSAVLTLIYF